MRFGTSGQWWQCQVAPGERFLELACSKCLRHDPLVKATCLLLPLALFAAAGTSMAQAVKDCEAAVRQDRAAMEKDERWLYNDFQRGFAEAKRTGKPLLVVLRCVPCQACAGIDAAVLLEETDLAPLLDQFVLVRVIDANALDLTLFQI